MSSIGEGLQQAAINKIRAGKPDEAVHWSRKAVELDPGSLQAWTCLGVALSETGQHEEARKAFRRAVQIDPNSARANYNLGHAYIREGTYLASAKQCFELTLKLNPEYPGAQAALDRLSTPIPRPPAVPNVGATARTVSSPGRTSTPPQAVSPRAERLEPIPGSASTPAVQRTAPVVPKGGWVAPGARVTVHGWELPDGMIYYGEKLASVGRGGTEPALINPRLKVSVATPDRLGSRLSYWPSYSDLSPESRAGYLEWLADGRKNPEVNAGFVFLFYYGLERRLLFDRPDRSQGHHERDLLIAEIERLLGIYDAHASFQSYATGLIDLVRVRDEPRKIYSLPPPTTNRYSWQLPLSLRVALGQLATDGLPVPIDWALAWAYHDPETRLRTPAWRCPDEFREIFATHYHKAYGEGVRLKPGKKGIERPYQPASSSFGWDLKLGFEDVLDGTFPPATAKKLRGIAEHACAALDAHSRLLGRKNVATTGIQRYALLPPELLAARRESVLAPFCSLLDRHLSAGSPALIPANELLRCWSGDDCPKLHAQDVVQLRQLLLGLGYGIEPDTAQFPKEPVASDVLAVFTLPTNSPTDPSPALAGARVLMMVAAAVACADGHVAQSEADHLDAEMRAIADLSSSDQARLSAYLRWLLAARPSIREVKKLLKKSGLQEVVALSRFVMLSVASADGQVSPAEIQVLTELYQELGLEPAEIFHFVHSASMPGRMADDEPVVVRPGGVDHTGYAIPRHTPATDSFRLDQSVIQKKAEDTERVARLLKELVAENEEVFAPATTSAEATVLDAKHRALLHSACTRPEWSRGEFDELARNVGLLPTGAVDVINEAAIEATGEPALEGDDVITVNIGPAEELLALCDCPV